MGSVPFAFSIHQFVSSVGSDAGFASIVGLAILVLLYFAQARETAGLREQAYEAAQRVDHLEARLAEFSRQSASAAAVSAPAPASAGQVANAGSAPPPAPVAAPAPTPVPAFAGPPAGVAAPALSAATRLIPVGVTRSGGASPRPPMQERAPDLTTVGGPAPVPALGSPPVQAPAPATAAAAANGGTRERTVPPPVAARAGGPAPPAPPRPSPPPGGKRRPSVPPPPPKRARSRTGRIIAVVVALLAAAAAAVVLLILTSGNSSSPTSTNASHLSTGAGAGAGARRPPAFSPKKVTVAVLNGTASQGLAGRTSHRLAAAGYKSGTVATAANQTETTTMVAYLRGYRADAMRVAAALKLSAASVQPISQTAQAVACPPPAACTANVVVTVGADLASP